MAFSPLESTMAVLAEEDEMIQQELRHFLVEANNQQVKDHRAICEALNVVPEEYDGVDGTHATTS